MTLQNDSLKCNLIIITKAQFNNSIFIVNHDNPHLVTQQLLHKLISTSILIFKVCHFEQLPQTNQVSSALELTLLSSEVIFVTIFGMAGMNLGTSVSAATRSAFKFRVGTMSQLQQFHNSLISFFLFKLIYETSAILTAQNLCLCFVVLHSKFHTDFLLYIRVIHCRQQ
ncbi:Hypothetical_protein [Hexamita inflata]|uniref:Hypothetical_protein n=1 Tax=Hexamita inflata TaxID=28002 RepID=A0AA86Q4L6_9EUKA|nr:Hypothetical protein HINF_LOCUS33204 [Hexamita inflata]